MNYFLLLVIFFVQTSYGISAPEYTNHYFKYAMEDFQNEKYESALKRLEKIKKSGIYSRRAIELYAHTLMKLKRFDEAIDTFEEMANFYHPEGFVYHKNIPETEDYLGKRKTSKNPPDRVLDYYQDLGHIHFMILKENMEKRDVGFVVFHFNQATKYYYICQEFGHFNQKMKSDLNNLQEIYDRKPPYFDQLHLGPISSESSTDTIVQSKTVEQLDQVKLNAFKVSLGGHMWTEKSILSGNNGAINQDLNAEVIGQSASISYLKRSGNFEFEYLIEPFVGQAKVKSKSNVVYEYENDKTDVKGVLTGIGYNWYWGEDLKVGLRGNYVYRSINWQSPGSGFNIDNKERHSAMLALTGNYLFKNVGIGGFIGRGINMDDGWVSLQLSYQLDPENKSNADLYQENIEDKKEVRQESFVVAGGIYYWHENSIINKIDTGASNQVQAKIAAEGVSFSYLSRQTNREWEFNLTGFEGTADAKTKSSEPLDYENNNSKVVGFLVSAGWNYYFWPNLKIGVVPGFMYRYIDWETTQDTIQVSNAKRYTVMAGIQMSYFLNNWNLNVMISKPVNFDSYLAAINLGYRFKDF